MPKIIHFIRQSWLLIVAAFLFGLLIAVTNAALEPRIARNEKARLYNLMIGLISDANDFVVAIPAVQVPDDKGRSALTDIYNALDSNKKSLGFAFVAVGPGFADKIKLVIAVDDRCEKFFGFKVLASNETPGFGSKIKEDSFGDQFIRAPAAKIKLVKVGDLEKIDAQIVAISGATVSSEAVVKIFNTYIDKIREQLQIQELIGNDR